MSQKSIAGIQLVDIFSQVVAQTKIISLEHCQAVWQCFSKTVISLVDSHKSALILDMFYIKFQTNKNLNIYEWIPTISLLQKCGLNCGQQIPQLTMVTMLTKQKMARNFAKEQSLSRIGNSEDVGWSILQLIFKAIRQNLAQLQNIDINIGYFGVLKKQLKNFRHILRQDKNIRIKKLMSPRKKTSNLRISRRSSQNTLTLEEEASQNHSQEESIIVRAKKSSNITILSPLGKSVNFLNIHKEILPGYKQRSFINNFSVPDTRISNDLLGAGIDPLKYDYNYSKLVNETSKLFYKTFTKPKPAKIRHPGIIDKFERTAGVPQTGLKVSNSVVVRIGSNYNRFAKNIYCDIKEKCILFVPREPRIVLNEKSKVAVQCASQEEEYRYVASKDPQLRDRVQQRESNYKRYCKYIENYIDNTNVCPILSQSIQRILNQVKGCAEDFKNQSSLAIANQVMNEANQEYYRAYKKSILDYILKDSKERERTSIHVVFRPPTEWGQRKVNSQSPLYVCKVDKNTKVKASKMLTDHLFHPKCVLEIANFNLKMKDLDLFRMKNQDNKPVNVLYFIKKQHTHIADIISYLSSDWIKRVASIVSRHINFDEEPEKKTTTFIRLINVMLSNTLKNIVYQSFNKLVEFFNKFSKKSATYQHPILQINMTDENGKFVLSDDFKKILTDEIRNLILTIIGQSKKIHGVEFYLKDQSNSYLWSQQKDECFYEEVIEKIIGIIEENCQEIDKFKSDFDQYQQVLQFQEQTIQWLKAPHSLQEISTKSLEIEKMQSFVQTIPYCFVNKMILIECFDQKQKLKAYLCHLKIQLHQNLRSLIEKSNFKSYTEIQEIKRTISTPIQNTSDYMKVASELDEIKRKRLHNLVTQMQYNRKCLIKLLDMGYGSINSELLEKIYMTNKILRTLNTKIEYHEDRLSREKVHLQSKLRERMKAFEISTQTQLGTISARIDQFELRRVFNDYLMEINSFKDVVQQNNQTAAQLNNQQQDLKWSKTVFKAAEELKNIVLPNYDLWILVLEFDCMMKQWKNKEICQMDVGLVKRRVQQINIKVSKTIKKLKNLSSLKVAYELQKDTKDILNKHVQIIQIFSHPGLKERHWQLFNTKLMIPGVDLKQIPYSKIKIFEEYEKNLKVLSVISTQAAKQYEIENERNEQQQYWMGITFQTYSSAHENNFCISDTFLTTCLSLLQEHSSRLAVMKNYLYSKALYQQLQEWELWLGCSKKNLQNLKIVQQELSILRPLFSYEQIAKQLPIENSEFQSIDNYWKTLTKKIWEHSKLYEFMKSPKISEMIEELLKKIQILKRGTPLFLMMKRSQFPRFYFLKDSQLTNLLTKAAYQATEKQATNLAFNQCFANNLTLIQNDQKFLSLRSETDSLILTSDVYQLKSKKKLCENLIFLQKCMRESVRSEILKLLGSNILDSLEDFVQKYSLTAIFCERNISFGIQLLESISEQKFTPMLIQRRGFINKLLQLAQQQKTSDFLMEDKLKRLKKWIRVEKIILSVVGEIDKITQLQSIGDLNINSFEYLSLVKFVLKTNQNHIGASEIEELLIPENKIQDKQTQVRQKLNSVCKNIRNLRKSSSKSKSIMSNSRVHIEVMDKILEFREQFWGDETHNYMPSFSQKTNFLILSTVISNKISCLTFSKACTVARKLAILCGQHFTQIESEFFGEEQGLSCIFHGIVASKSWILLHCDKLKLKHRNYDKLNSLIGELREKKQQGSQNIIQSPVVSGYVKCLSQVCDMSLSSACFLNFPEPKKFQQIPQSFRSQMRSISLNRPPFAQYLKKQCTKFVQTTGMKEKLAQNWIFDMVSEYQKPEESKMQTKQLLKLTNTLSMSNNPKVRYELLEQYASCKFEIGASKQPIHNILHAIASSTELQFLPKHGGKEQIHHQSSLVTPSLLKQKQKLSYNELHERSKQQMSQCLEKYDVAVLYGRFDIKTDIAMKVVQEFPGYSQIQRELYSFPACALDYANIDAFVSRIVERLVLELNKVFLQKSYKKIAKEARRDVCLHLQHMTQLDERTASALLGAVSRLEETGIVFQQSATRSQVKIKVILDCVEMVHISPSTALRMGKVYLQIPQEFAINQYFYDWLCDNIKIDKQRSEDSRVNYQSVMYSLKCLEPTFQQILALALKTQPAKVGQSVMDVKYILTVRFLKMFKTYIDHLDNKQIDEYIEYDVNSYINNSFIYCVYWTICVGFMKPHESFIIEQALLKEHFPEVTEIQEISKYMLNQENQWLNWSSLKEEFTLFDAKNIPIYNVWVSTEQNMKIYTNVIKMLEKGLKVMVIGQKCSGKSTLLKQISNFEMSYTSFLIDCNRTTRAEEVAEVVKNRIFYTKKDKKLILIDDIHMPVEETSITQIIKKLVEENILCFKFDYCRRFWSNKKLQSHLSVLVTCTSQNFARPERQGEGEKSMSMLDGYFQRFNIRELIEVDISTIYGAYVGYSFEKLKLKLCEKAGEFEALFSGFMCKIYRKFNLDFHTLNRIVKLFFTKLEAHAGGQKKQEEQTPGSESKRSVSLLETLKMINCSIFTILGAKTNFEAIVSTCLEETNKAMGSSNFKHQEEFCQKINAEKYNYLPHALTQSKSWNGQDISEKNTRERAELVSNLIQQCVTEKNEGIHFIPTTVHNELILKIYSFLKICPSHIIILSEIGSSKLENDSKWIEANGLGLRTIMKIVTYILSINFNEIEQESVSNFINDSLNIIKAGGKIDESVYYVCRNQFKSMLHSVGHGKEMISAINSFICSPELYQFFTEQRIEQIFVKFSSQKKTLKRSQFIRKVREKIHLLFHFIISIDAESYHFLTKNYPNLVKECHIIQLHKLPQESLYEIANKVLRPQPQKRTNKDILSNPSIESSISISLSIAQPTVESQKNKRNVINSLLQIYYNFENIMKQRFRENHPAYIIKYKLKSIYEYFEIFRSLKKKYDQLNKKQEMNGEVWSNRRKETEQKYEQLLNQKSKIYNDNEEYFIKSKIINSQIERKIEEHGTFAEEANQLHLELKSQMDRLKTRKHDSNEYTAWPQYQQLLDLEQSMKEMPHEQFERLYKNTRMTSKMKVINANFGQSFDLDFKTNILEALEKLRLYRSNNMQDLMQEFMAQLVGISGQDEGQAQTELQANFILWQKQYVHLVEKVNQSCQMIKNQQAVVAQLQAKIKTNKSHQKSVENHIQELKQQLGIGFRDSGKISAHYEQICRAVSQIEPILNIFKHFQKVIKASNRKNGKESGKETDAITVSKAYGSLIMATAYIAFAFYLGLEEDQQRFWAEAKSAIRANGLEVDESKIFDSILNSEEVFKNKYGRMEANDSQTVCQIGFNSNTCSLVRVEEQEVINFYAWLEQTSERTVKIVENNNEVGQINECLSNGYIGVVVNPNSQVVKKLKPLINYDIQVKNNAICVNITEQIIINTTSRIIFVVTPSYIEEGKLSNSILTNLWQLNFQRLNHAFAQCQQIYELLSKKGNYRNELIKEHLQLFQELSKIDKRIEKMIMSIRKNNENPDRIIMKIEAISEQKQSVIAKMEQIVDELDQIDATHHSGPLKEAVVSLDDKVIQQICQAVLPSDDQALPPLQFNSLVDYLRVLTKVQCSQIHEIRQKICGFAEIFLQNHENKTKNKDNSKQQTKFRKIQIEQGCLQMKIERILEPVEREDKINTCNRNDLWHSYLSQIFNLHSHADQFKSQTNKEVLKISLNSKLIEQSPQSASLNSNSKHGKNILVYRTDHADTMSKYFLSLLVERKEQAYWKQINCLADYNAKNIGSDNVVNITEIRNYKDWKYIGLYIGSEEERSTKRNNQKLIIVCDGWLSVPAQIQPHVHTVCGTNEIKQLATVMRKLWRVPTQYEQMAWQIQAQMLKQAKQGKRNGIDEQELVEEILYVEQMKIGNSQKSKYLATMLIN